VSAYLPLLATRLPPPACRSFNLEPRSPSGLSTGHSQAHAKRIATSRANLKECEQKKEKEHTAGSILLCALAVDRSAATCWKMKELQTRQNCWLSYRGIPRLLGTSSGFSLGHPAITPRGGPTAKHQGRSDKIGRFPAEVPSDCRLSTIGKHGGEQRFNHDSPSESHMAPEIPLKAVTTMRSPIRHSARAFADAHKALYS